MNYKNACLTQPGQVKKPIKANVAIKPTDEKAKFNRSCARALAILHSRWTKYKEDYIALHGEDEYERMYLTPNYWVMPEDNDNNEDSDREREDDYYASDYSSA